MERPILFTPMMVTSLLQGRKTRTRRLVSPQPLPPFSPSWSYERKGEDVIGRVAFGPANGRSADGLPRWWPAPAVTGDLLWVREPWRAWMGMGEASVDYSDGTHRVVKNWSVNSGGMHVTGNDLADYDHGDWCEKQRRSLDCWRPSIHMPRAASRQTLLVGSVWVERVQDITEEEAGLEGIPVLQPDDIMDTEHPKHMLPNGMWLLDSSLPTPKAGSGPGWAFTAREAFAVWWDHLHGAGSWASNPWVWALAFEVVS